MDRENAPRTAPRIPPPQHGGDVRVVDLTRADQANGRVRSDMDPESIAALLLSLALGAVTAVDAGLCLDIGPAGDDKLRMLRSG